MYQETCEYTDDGRLSSFEAVGYMEHESGGDPEESLLSISWIYRDDGTLYRRDYSHNHLVFGSEHMSECSYYDELGRLVYKDTYLTNGSDIYYYIYEDEGDKPSYCLSFDDGSGYSSPAMIVYR